MAITAPCPNCKRDVAVAFDLSSGSKFLPCPCGETVQYTENILSMAQPIKYEEKYPVFSAFGPDSTNLGRLGDKVLFTKAKCWKHEDEWRIGLTGFDARLVKSPHPILEGIIFGCNMKSKERSEIVDLNNRRTKPVALFETRKMKFEFALEIVPLKL
jgi:hypothetical protein